MKYLRITTPDVNNGPGCRVTLWIPGCGHKCKGCHNLWTHTYNQGRDFTEDTYAELLDMIKKPYISGLTISGGDPLHQSNNVLADLYEWITRIRVDAPDKTIWLYTGFKIEDLRGIQLEVAQKCDVVVDGPYIEELKDTTLEFRGSSNQRIIYMDQWIKDHKDSGYIISNQSNKKSMKKTVFKGVINGQEFDNVNDYNTRMRELINAGETIEATSSTQIHEVCDFCKQEPCICNEEVSPVVMLPGFEVEGSHYLDRLVSNDTSENKRVLEFVKQNLNESLPKVLDKIKNMDLAALESYMNDVDKAVHILQGDRVSSDNALDNLDSKFKELETKKEILKAGLNFINLYDDFYQEVLKVVYERAGELDDQPTKQISDSNNKFGLLLKVLGLI